ncbi:MAG: phenylalanine--tRNA ligase subunit beta, partial [Euryarchaeota archaeon]|nr:phenylalanine--tRNA ligase subunit beta [Euryarchaeota archaeon]
MPIITLQYTDLEQLTQAEKDDIIERVPMIGADIERIEDESIDIEFFPDRPDLYSVEGVARAMRGFMNIKTGLRKYDVGSSGIDIETDDKIKDIRPIIACAVVRGIRFNSSSIKSLMDLQESLHWGLGRDRKKVSIGVHDLLNVEPPFRYIAVNPDFKFTPLDFTEPITMGQILEQHPKGVKFASILEGMDKYPLIIDSNDNVLSFPPIINGTLTRVEESTTDLLIEVTGLSAGVDTALNIVVTSLAERGGVVESIKVISPDGSEKVTPNLSPSIRELPIDEVEALIGIAIPASEICTQLERMGFGAKPLDDGKTIEVLVPSYRADILHDYDLIEDIAVGYGYHNIAPKFPKNATVGKAHPISLTRTDMREIMVGLGYYEVMPFTLTSQRVHLDWMRRERTDDITDVLHPISEDQTMVRPTILPNLVEVLSLNQHHELPQRIFEVGEVVINGKNHLHMAAVSIHPQANFTEIRELVDAVMRERKVDYEVAESEDPAFLDGRRADIVGDGEIAGVMGELHPEVITNFGLGQPVVGFEIAL